jgi:hypothetical protein
LHGAGFDNKKIAEVVGYREQRVSYLLKTLVFPQKRKGHLPVLDSAKWQKLVDFIIASPESRQLKYFRSPLKVSRNAYKCTIGQVILID